MISGTGESPRRLAEGDAVDVDELWLGTWAGPRRLRVEGGVLHVTSERVGDGATFALGGTVFPRLIDHHVHLGLVEPAALMRGGITEAHDLGWIPSVAAEWRLRAARGDLTVPATQIAGGFLTCVGGYPLGSGWAPRDATIQVASRADARRAVAEMAGFGASRIKITLNTDAGPVLDDDLLRAVVTAAHDAALLVVAHAEGVGQTARALDAGVDTLAHAPFSERLDDAVIARMAAGMRWISTLDIHGWGTPTPAFHTARDNVSRFLAAGGRVLYGTDLGNGPLPVGVNERELVALADAGADRDRIVRMIAGGEPSSETGIGPRFAWVPGRPPATAHGTARWLATARGCSVGDLPSVDVPSAHDVPSRGEPRR